MLVHARFVLHWWHAHLAMCAVLRVVPGQGDLLNEVGSGVGQWVQQQAEELSKLQQGAAEVLGGVVHKAEESIKAGRLVSGRDTFFWPWLPLGGCACSLS